MKKLLVLGAMALVPFTLAGCGTEPTPPENTPEEVVNVNELIPLEGTLTPEETTPTEEVIPEVEVIPTEEVAPEVEVVVTE
jgi:hypothetical protein